MGCLCVCVPLKLMQWKGQFLSEYFFIVMERDMCMQNTVGHFLLFLCFLLFCNQKYEFFIYFFTFYIKKMNSTNQKLSCSDKPMKKKDQESKLQQRLVVENSPLLLVWRSLAMNALYHRFLVWRVLLHPKSNSTSNNTEKKNRCLCNFSCLLSHFSSLSANISPVHTHVSII